jgi:hypothetical protein
MKKADFLQHLAGLVSCANESQGLLASESQSNLVGDVMVRLGNIGDESVGGVYPTVNRSLDGLTRGIVPVSGGEVMPVGMSGLAGGHDGVRDDRVG